MTKTLILLNERLISNTSEMNHNCLRPIKVLLDSRKHKLHLFGQINTFDISEMSNKGLRPRKI